MAESFPTPEQISTSAADALGGSTDQRTQIVYLAESVGPDSSPTFIQQMNRILRRIREVLAGAAQGYCYKTATLTVGALPLRYRKSDASDVLFEGGTLVLTANQTNSVYVLHSSNALTKSTSGFPADKTTFTPLAVFVCDASDITTANDAADRRNLSAQQTNASSTSPTGTTQTSFTIDDDNAGAGVDQQLRYNRGSTDAEDAAVEWDEANDRFNFYKKHTAKTICPLNAEKLMINGTDVFGTDGDLEAASIATDQLYVFGEHGFSVAGIRITAMGSAGAPASGTHAVGEFAMDSAAQLFICVTAGTPGTWEKAGNQNNIAVVSIADNSGTANNPIACTLQMKDSHGVDRSGTQLVRIRLMDDVDGGADAANTSAVSASTGTLVRTITANKDFVFKTDASGTLVFNVTNSIADIVYILPEPAPGSPALDCADTAALTWS